MRNQISMIDFNCDWYLRDCNLTPRSTPGTMSREDVIAFLGTLDVDAIEVMYDYWKDVSAASVCALAAEAGLPIGCCIFMHDLALPATERAAAIEQAKPILDRTAELGAPLAMIVPGLVKPDYALDDQRDWMIDGLAACAELAESRDLTLLAENIDMPEARELMGKGADCRAICDAVGSTAFRLIYDTGCTEIMDEDPIDTLREMAPCIAHVHVKNFRRLQPDESAHRSLISERAIHCAGCDLDAGEVDLGRILNELVLLDYDGMIAIEYQGEGDPHGALPHNVQVLRNLLESM
jgi:sugar phosphate isomerase/epimerase